MGLFDYSPRYDVDGAATAAKWSRADRRRRRRWRNAAWVAGGIGLIAIAAIFLTDWNEVARSYAVRVLEAKTGRPVSLEKVTLHWQLPFVVEANGLTIGGPDWSRERELAGFESLRATVLLWPLVRGELRMPELLAVGPRLALEESNGQRSWVDERSASSGGATVKWPAIERLVIERGRVQILVPGRRIDVGIAFDQRAPSEGDEPSASIQATGTFEGQPVRVQGTVGSLDRLADQARYPIDLVASIGGTHAIARGTIADIAALDGIDIALDLRGNSLNALYPILGLALPDTPPYRLRGQLVRTGAKWQYERFQGRLGDSDLGGSIAVTLRAPERPLMTGRLSSQLLDLNDLGPLIGAPPGTGPGETASTAQRQRAAAVAASTSVLPDISFGVEKWRTVDADVRLDARRIRRPAALPLDDLRLRLVLQNNVLRLTPLRFGVAGGEIAGNVSVDARNRPVRGVVEMTAHDLQLPLLFPQVEKLSDSSGRLFGRIRLNGRGESIKALFASASGSLDAAIAGGTISNLLVELVGLDAGEALKFLVSGDRIIPIRCALAGLDVAEGQARTRVMVIDTTDTNIVGTGGVDFRDEQLDLTFHPAPKDVSVLVGRAPLHIQGPFKQPTIAPDLTAIAGRGTAAILLGLVNPLLALAPLVETGPGKDSDCSALLADARRWSAPAPNARKRR